MKKLILFISMFFVLFSVQIFAQDGAQTNLPQKQTEQPPNCKIIRAVSYPITQTRSTKTKMRIAVVNLCPANPGMEARPMYPLMINGEIKMFEYSIDRVFKDQKEAKKFAKKNKITDVSF